MVVVAVVVATAVLPSKTDKQREKSFQSLPIPQINCVHSERNKKKKRKEKEEKHRLHLIDCGRFYKYIYIAQHLRLRRASVCISNFVVVLRVQSIFEPFIRKIDIRPFGYVCVS